MLTLKQWYLAAKKSGGVHVVCEHVARSNMSARYNLHTVVDGELCIAWPTNDAGEYDEALAKKLGFVNKRTGKQEQGFVRKGFGYDRAADVLIAIGEVCAGDNSNVSQGAIRLRSINR
jgi:hypothetical protein